jgi:1-acyl-sn-glycerol-3-phosphate acyltransferase
MIEVNKKQLATRAMSYYQRYHIRHTFATLKVRYHAEVPGQHELPTIYYANHSSKWDHHVGGYITERLWGQDSYYMIAYQMMKIYPILKYVGGFSIHQSNPLEAAKGMDYCSELLNAAPNRVVWVFPQGGIYPNGQRPLNFQQGTAQLIRLMGRVRVVPVTFRYEFLYCSKPDLFVNFGKPVLFERPIKTTTRKLTEQLETTLTTDLDQLTADVTNGRYQNFEVVLSGKGIFLNRVYTRLRYYQYLVSDKLGLIKEDEDKAIPLATAAADGSEPVSLKATSLVAPKAE